MSLSGTTSPSSPPSSLTLSNAEARSPRVCIPCRRKKKRCDKALPACGRCLKWVLQVRPPSCGYVDQDADEYDGRSFDACQHEGDPGVMPEDRLANPQMIEAVAATDLVGFATHFNGGSDSGISMAGSSSFLLESTNDIHLSGFHCMLRLVGSRAEVEQTLLAYFNSVNIWFNVIDYAHFTEEVKAMWIIPSVETELLVLCQALVTRQPGAEGIAATQDGLYISTKMLFTLVEAKIPMGFALYQAALLVALYEACQGLTEKAFLTLHTCVAMSQALGWQREAFWAEERRDQFPAELQKSSILWWATCLIDW